MASASKPSLTAEQLSDIVEYEKIGPRDMEANYDMLLDEDMAMPEHSSSASQAGLGPHRHRRKKNRPVQYRPTDKMGAVKRSAATEDLQNDSPAFTSILPPDLITSTSRDTSPDGREKNQGSPGDKSQGSVGVMPFDPSNPRPINMVGIADIHKTLAKQLEEATAFADSEHQPCPFCSYVFSSVVFLVRHLKYRHGINLEMQVGMPQDAAKESPIPTPQSPTIDNQEHPSMETVCVSGSCPADASGIEQKQNDTGQKQNDTGQMGETARNGDNGILEPHIRPSNQITEVRRSDLPNELMLQRMDQLTRPTLTQVAADNPPGQPIIVCDKCTRAFTTLEDLEQHHKIHNITKTYECDHCHKLFQNPSSLKKHTKLHTDGKIYACDHCNKSFAAAAYLKTHMRLHTKQKPFVCKHCGKAFAASGTLISHERIHINDKPYGCEFCGKRFRQGSHLNRHKIIHTNLKPHVCSRCNRAFADVANLRRHERIHNQDNPNVCAECGKSFINLSSLKKHERLHTNEKPYICRHCSKPFASSGNLISHERTHTNERPYVCKECGKAFTQSSHLKAHMGTHSTDTLYVCKHCGRGFTQRSTLCVHERIHLNKKPYICKICDRAFTQSSTLKAHIRTHTKEKAHVCKICGKAFSARGNLRSHELIHTDEKPFKCGVCPKAFKQGSTLRAHERTHTKERPYVCRVCGKAFADRSNLKAHTLRIHCKGPSLDLRQGDDLLASTMLAQTLNEIPDPEVVYSANKFNNLGTDPGGTQSPVGIKIKKTLEGLTSMLRFNKEGNTSPSNSSDQIPTQQSLLTNDNTEQDTEASAEDILEPQPQIKLITDNSDTKTSKSLTEDETENNSSQEHTSSCKTLNKTYSTLEVQLLSYNSTDSVLDLSRWPSKLNEARVVEEQQKKQILDNFQVPLSESGVNKNKIESIEDDAQSMNQYPSQSSSSHFETGNAGDSQAQEASDDELTFDEDDDDDLESLPTVSESNSSDEEPELLSEHEDTSSGSSQESPGNENPDLQRDIELRNTRLWKNTEFGAINDVANGTPSATKCISERYLHLENRRPKEEVTPVTDNETFLDAEDGSKNRELSKRDATLENIRPKVDVKRNRNLECESVVRVHGKQDTIIGGSTRCETSKSQLENLNCKQTLIEDLELARILPLN